MIAKNGYNLREHSTIEVQWKYEIPREFHLGVVAK